MAAFTPANSIGWAAGDQVTSVQMNALDQDHVKAPNFVDGLATYNPAGLIQVGGAGLQWNGPSVFSATSVTTWESGSSCVWEDGSTSEWQDGSTVTFGDGCLVTVELDCTIELFGGINVRSGGGIINVSSGGVIDFDSGGLITGTATVDNGAALNFVSGSSITGSLSVNSGASVSFASGTTQTMQSGATMTAASGSIVNLGGTTTLTNSTSLALSPARNWERHSLRIALVSFVQSTSLDPAPTNNYEGPERPSAWMCNHTTPPESGFSSPFIRTLETNTDTHGEQHYHWIGLDDLPHNGTFSEVVVRSTGTGTTPTTTAKFRIVRVSSAGTVENMSDLTDRTGTWTDSMQTTVSVNAHATISTAYRYALVVLHPFLTGGATGPSLRIFDVESSGTVASMTIG